MTWFHHSLGQIIREDMGIPLSNELLKQAGRYEGDANFLYRLAAITRNDGGELTEKQVNFLARMLLQNYAIMDAGPIGNAMRDLCLKGLRDGKRTKNIEQECAALCSGYRSWPPLPAQLPDHLRGGHA